MPEKRSENDIHMINVTNKAIEKMRKKFHDESGETPETISEYEMRQIVVKEIMNQKFITFFSKKRGEDVRIEPPTQPESGQMIYHCFCDNLSRQYILAHSAIEALGILRARERQIKERCSQYVISETCWTFDENGSLVVCSRNDEINDYKFSAFNEI